ncbi:hypothetical protein ACLKA6_004921 [Drosophila palustris]
MIVLDYLKENGCTRTNLEVTARTRRQNSQEIIDFFCSSYEKAQESVNEDRASLSLSNINQWLELMKVSKLSTLCEFEAAAVLNAIVRNEPQPEPEQLAGVNMSEIYGFLENALTGQPQKQLSAASEAFFSREIELLIAEANTDDSDDVARDMGQNFYSRQEYNYEAEPHKCSLDPLFIDD